MKWLESLNGDDDLRGVQYAVYSCGNRDWASTFHKVPKSLDVLFAANGANRIAPLGLGDVAGGQIFIDFETWQDGVLWPVLNSGTEAVQDDLSPDLDIHTSYHAQILKYNVGQGIVIDVKTLTTPEAPTQKRHLTVKLPSGTNYVAGDYLAILPMNNMRAIRRVVNFFGLPRDTVLHVRSSGHSMLPSEHSVSLLDILGSYVELGRPATRRYIRKISLSVKDPTKRSKISHLADTDFGADFVGDRLSALDILEDYPESKLCLGVFLSMLPPMRIRQFSISSSPLDDPTVASITWSVIDKERFGRKENFLGVASTFLSELKQGDRIHVTVRPGRTNFRCPENIEHTPIIMVYAGSGIAPFRGFIQERSIQTRQRRVLAPAYLFVGCTHPDRDDLYRDELRQWEREGVVLVFWAFSRLKEQSYGCRYVQDRLWKERAKVTEAIEWERGSMSVAVRR